MGFWKRLFFRKREKRITPRLKGDFISFAVKCDKCGEEIRINVNRRTDIQSLYTEPGEKGASYTLKKEILGRKCPNLINITVDFDRGYRVLSRNISGGKFISPEEQTE
ncbi:MAG: hypothetical protein ACE5K3_02675 [bacterium]